MKNLINFWIPFFVFFFFLPQTKAQQFNAKSFPPNEATVFEFDNTNPTGMVTTILDSINAHYYPNSAPFLPNPAQLMQFISTPFNNQIYAPTNGTCPTPGTRLNSSSGNKVAFSFDNIGPNQNRMIYHASMDYINGSVFISPSVNGSEVYGGLSTNMGQAQFHIYVFGTLCSQNPPSFGTQFYSNLEIVIIDKDIL